MNASRLAMLVALVGLIYVISPWSFSLDGIGGIFDGSFPWIIFGVVLFFATRKGGCGRKTASCGHKFE